MEGRKRPAVAGERHVEGRGKRIMNSQKTVEGIKEQQKETAALESEDVELWERIKAL